MNGVPSGKQKQRYKIAWFCLLLNLEPLACTNTDNVISTRKCEQFSDTRTTTEPGPLVAIPKQLTHRGENELNLKMMVENQSEDQCQSPTLVKFSLPLGKGGVSSQDNYKVQEGWRHKKEEFFTDDGYLHHQGAFVNPTDFCIKSISDTELLLKICQVNCAGDLSTTYLYTSTPEPVGFGTARVCLPKCCGIDETLSVTDMTCRSLNSTESTYFRPYLHLPAPIWFLSDSEKAVKDKILVMPRNMRGDRTSFNGTHGHDFTKESIWERLHFFRSSMNCNRLEWQGIYYEDADDFGRNGKNRYNFRVAVDGGTVKLQFLTNSRKWRSTHNSFCVDGVDGWYPPGTPTKAMASIAVLCADDIPEGRSLAQWRRGTLVVNNQEERRARVFAILHLTVLAICTIILFLGFITYCLLAPRWTVYGKIFASHLGTVTFSYLIYFVSDTTSVVAYVQNGSNGYFIAGKDSSRRISGFCVGVAVVAHYLYLSAHFWMSCLNSDVWGQLKGWGKRYWVYCLVGWGAPAIYIIICGVVDFINNDAWLDKVMPDYGVETCYISGKSNLYYVQIIVGIMFLLNLSCMLAKSAHNYYRRRFSTSEAAVMLKTREGIPSELFTNICMVQLVNWLMTFPEWFEDTVSEEVHLGDALLLSVGSFLESWILVNIYCLNEVVLTLLAERVKWAWLRRSVLYLQEKKAFTSRSQLVACGFEKEKYKNDSTESIDNDGSTAVLNEN